MLTAAHVVYNKSGLKFKIFTDHDTQSNIPITPVAYHVPSEYVNNNNICYDYAIVTVEEDLECYNGYGYEDYSFINFDLGLMRNEMSLSKPVYVTGFGGDGVITPELEDVKSTGVGTLLNTSNTDTDYRIYFDTDIVPGNSGSPVYIKNPDGSNSVIGICTHQSTYYNSGIRITSDILKFVFNNSHL